MICKNVCMNNQILLFYTKYMKSQTVFLHIWQLCMHILCTHVNVMLHKLNVWDTWATYNIYLHIQYFKNTCYFHISKCIHQHNVSVVCICQFYIYLAMLYMFMSLLYRSIYIYFFPTFPVHDFLNLSFRISMFNVSRVVCCSHTWRPAGFGKLLQGSAPRLHILRL